MDLQKCLLQEGRQGKAGHCDRTNSKPGVTVDCFHLLLDGMVFLIQKLMTQPYRAGKSQGDINHTTTPVLSQWRISATTVRSVSRLSD